MAARLTKLLRAIDLLSRPMGATINELAEHLEVDRRSVYRQKDAVEDLGIPLYDDKNPSEREKRWRILEEYVKKMPNLNVPNFDLTLSEIIALYLLKGHAKFYKGTEIDDRLESAFKKISQLVPAELCKQLDKISSLFVPISKFGKDYGGKESIIDMCTAAMLGRKTCFVKYHSFSGGEIKNFKIDPLCFFERAGGLYVFVRATSFGEIRMLALERIQELEPTGEEFEPVEDFDPEKLLRQAFDVVYDDPIEVKIWFSADQAPYIKERKWAEYQHVEENHDGSIILTMKTSGWWDVKKWVLSYGAEAEVLEPRELKEEIIKESLEALKKYGLRMRS
jgi:predicted DNA-binding transcriptional regulator YafY